MTKIFEILNQTFTEKKNKCGALMYHTIFFNNILKLFYTVSANKQYFDVHLNMDKMSTIYKQYINKIYENYFK